jgi:hypothetical protein
MATTSTTETTRTTQSKRWSIPACALALSAAMLGVVALAVPAMAENQSSGSHIIECRSGIVTDGDVQMSALTVTRVPAAQLPDTTPGDCSVR